MRGGLNSVVPRVEKKNDSNSPNQTERKSPKTWEEFEEMNCPKLTWEEYEQLPRLHDF